jgi:TP901 family phage tail tape measure protein
MMADRTNTINVEVILNGLKELQNFQRSLGGLQKAGEGARKAGADVGGLGDKAKKTEKDTSSLMARLAALNSRFDEASRAINKTGDTLEASGNKSAVAGRKYEALGQKIDRLKAQARDLEGGFKAGTVSSSQLETRLAGLQNRVVGVSDQTANFQARLNDTGKGVVGFNQRLQSMHTQISAVAQGLGRIGTALTATFTVPLVGGAVASTKAAISFEDSFAGVRKTVDATDAELNKLALDFRALSKEIPIPVNEINKIGEAAGQLGVKNKDILLFTRVMADLGATTNLTSEQAADGFARFANIINNQAGPQFDRLGATVVDLGNKSAATESQILEMALRVAGAGKQIGLTEAQILSFSTALSSVGLDAEAGGSAISRTFVDIAQAVAKGGRDLETFAKVSGMSAGEFKKAFQTDAAGAITTFINGLGEVQKQGGNTFGVLEALGITEIRQRDALLRLAGAGDLLNQTLKTGDAAWASNSALTEEARKRYETTASQLTILWNRIKDIGITLGGLILPLVRPIVDYISRNVEPAVNRLVELIQSLPAPIQTVLGVVALALAALGPLLLALSALAPIISAIAAVGAEAALAIAAAIPAIAGVVAIIVGVGIAAYKAWQVNLGGFRDTTIAVFTAVRDFIAEVFNEIKKIFDEVYPYLVAVVQAALQAIQEFWETYGTQIKNIVLALWDAVKAIVLGALKIIGGIIKAILQLITGDFSGFADTLIHLIENLIVLALNILKNLLIIIFNLGVAIIKALINGLISALKGLWDAAVKLGTAVWQGIKWAITEGIPAVLKVIGRIALAIITLGASEFFRAGNSLGAAFNGALQAKLAAGIQQAMAVAKNAVAAAQQSQGGSQAGTVVNQGPGTTTESSQPAFQAPKIDLAGIPTGKAPRTRKAKTEKPDLIDNEQKARDEARLQTAKEANEKLQRENDEAYALNLKSFERYVAQKLIIEQADIDNEISYQKQLLDAARVREGKSKEQRDIDAARAEQVKAQQTIDSLQFKRGELAEQVAHQIALNERDIQKEYDATRVRLLELSDARLEAAHLNIENEFKDKLERLTVTLTDASKALANATLKGDEDSADSLRATIKETQAEISRINAIKIQLKLNADFEDQQRAISDIEARRTNALAILNAQIQKNGTNEIEANKQRAALTEKYNAELQSVIQKLIQIGALSSNTDIPKLIAQLNAQLAAPLPGQSAADAVNQARNQTDLLLQAKQIRAQEIQDAVNRGVLSEVRAKQELLQLERERAPAILAALQAELALAEASKDQARVLAIQQQIAQTKQATVAQESWRSSIKATAEDALASGLQQFFTDLVSGAKTLKESVLDFARSFIAAIQQVIIKLIVVKILQAALGGFAGGGQVAAGGTGAGVPGAATGGLVGRLARFAGGGLAVLSRGAFGVIAGPGTGTSDSILARVSNKEYIMPADRTEMNLHVLEAIRSGMNFPRFAEGTVAGSPTAGAGGVIPAPVVNLRNINVLDSAMLADVITSPPGVQAVLNVIERNRNAINSRLGR